MHAAPPNKESFPPGLNNAFSFSGFNALSFQIILSSPMVLYAKSLGASATVLGIIAGMMPLLVIFQIPAASHVSRFGYKRFVLAGWSIRVIFIFLMATVPLLASILKPGNQVALLLFLLFFFNLSRGISSCAWLPWITSLVPDTLRGKYLAWEAAFVNTGSLVVMAISAFVLGSNPPQWRFAALFVFSALMGAVSLRFLKRIPDADNPEQSKASNTPVPWGAIFGYAPFQKLLWVNVAWSVAYGGLSTFMVAYLKSETTLSEQSILLVCTTIFIGGLCSLWLLGTRLDRFGSKPVLVFSCLVWVLVIGGWIALAARLVAVNIPLIVGLVFLMGLGASLVNMSNTRLAMVIVPVMGRSHFFALFSVVGSLTLGLAPIGWGLLIDAFGPLEVDWNGFEWNRYSVFFVGVLFWFFVTLYLCRRLEEPKAAGLKELLQETLIKSPQRFWFRLWPRG